MNRFSMRAALRPSPAMVVAVIALFVAMGGAGYAAATGSINSREIKNSTIRGKDVRNNGLTGRDVTRIRGGDVSNGSLTGNDVKDNSLTGNDLLESSLGQVPSAKTADTATTATNATSAANATTADRVNPGGVDTAAIKPYAVKGVRIAIPVRRSGASVQIGAGGQVATATASCGGGERLIGGGPEYGGDFPASTTPFPGGTVDSYPTSYYQWQARAYNGTGTTRSFKVWVLCIPDA